MELLSPESNPSPNQQQFWLLSSHGQVSALLGILLTQAMLLGYSATCHSPTALEPAFLVAGIRHWQTAGFELYHENPPLVPMIAALPVLAVGCKTDWSRVEKHPGARSEFMVGNDFINANGNDSIRLIRYARWACIPFSVLGAYCTYRWANDLYGGVAGLVSMCLFVFNPCLLAHGELVTPDLACVSLGLWSGYTYWKWLTQPSPGRAGLAGLAMGIAAISKFTWLTLFIVWPVLWVVRRTILNAPGQSASPAPSTLQLGLILLIATYCINACYHFDGFGTRLGEYAFVSETFGGKKAFADSGNRFHGTCLGSLPVPFPRQFVLGIDSQKRDFEHSATPSYFCGQWKLGGWWNYYLYGLAVKTPLGTLALLGTALGLCFTCRDTLRLLNDEIVLLAPAMVVLVLVSSQLAFNSHLRYAFPSLAFALVLTGRVTRCLRGRLRWIIPAALSCTIASTLFTFPHHLSYFNQLAGGSRNGYRHLLGSSFDWGQDLLSLRQFIADLPSGTRVAFAGPTGCSLIALGIDVDTRPLHWPLDTESPELANTLVIVSAAHVGTDGYTDAVFDDATTPRSTALWNSRLNSQCLHVVHAPAVDFLNPPQSPGN